MDWDVLREAVELHRKSEITAREALLRVSPRQLDTLIHPVLEAGDAPLLARGLPASLGAAVGEVVFSAAEAVARSARGRPVVLALTEVRPADVPGVQAAEGVLTLQGGLTCDAAVLARSFGKAAVAGCEGLRLDAERRLLKAAGRTLREGDWISLDGSDGRILAGAVSRKEVAEPALLADFLALTESAARVRVRAEANRAAEVARARILGAEGIVATRPPGGGVEVLVQEADGLPVAVRMRSVAPGVPGIEAILPCETGSDQFLSRARAVAVGRVGAWIDSEAHVERAARLAEVAEVFVFDADALDEERLLASIRTAVKNARPVRPDLRLAVCGTRAARAEAASRWLDWGVDWIGSRARLVPVLRLAIAQAALTRPGHPSASQ